MQSEYGSEWQGYADALPMRYESFRGPVAASLRRQKIHEEYRKIQEGYNETCPPIVLRGPIAICDAFALAW